MNSIMYQSIYANSPWKNHLGMKIYEKHRDKLLNKNINLRIAIWESLKNTGLSESDLMLEYIKRCRKEKLLTNRYKKKK